MNKYFPYYLLAILLLGGCSHPFNERTWEGITIGKDQDGRLEVILENELIKVRYGAFDAENKAGREPQWETAITEFIVKPDTLNLAGRSIDAAANRGLLTKAVIIQEDNFSKTVYMRWAPQKICPDGVQEITIFKDKPYIKIEYLAYDVNVVDISNGGGNYAIYGAEKWVRDFIPYPGVYFDRFHTDYENIVKPDPPDGGPLNYNNHFIMGLYHEESGLGWGRVVPVEAIPIIKLLPWEGKGFELFPWWNWSKVAYTCYIFGVRNGEEEIINLGKKIVDENSNE